MIRPLLQLTFSALVIALALSQPAVRQVAGLFDFVGSGRSQVAAVELVEAPATTSREPAVASSSVPDLSKPVVTLLPPLTSKFAIGDTGTAVKALQTMLKVENFYQGEVSGKYDSQTVAAVKAFQTRYELPVTPETAGSAGPGTRSKLNELYAGGILKPALEQLLAVWQAVRS